MADRNKLLHGEIVWAQCAAAIRYEYITYHTNKASAEARKHEAHPLDLYTCFS